MEEVGNITAIFFALSKITYGLHTHWWWVWRSLELTRHIFTLWCDTQIYSNHPLVEHVNKTHNYIEISTRGLTRSMLHAYCMFQVHFNLLECLKMYVHFLQPDDWEDWEFHFIIISQFGDLNNSLFLEMGLYIQILYICNELNLFYLFQSLVKAGLCINQT